VVGGYDPSRSQSIEDPWWWDIDRDEEGTPIHPSQPEPAVAPALPSGTRLLEVIASTARVETPSGLTTVDAFIGDAADPLLQGRFELIGGSYADAATEAMVSPGALDRLGIDVGDTVRLSTGETYTVTGTLKRAISRDDEPEVFLPTGA